MGENYPSKAYTQQSTILASCCRQVYSAVKRENNKSPSLKDFVKIKSDSYHEMPSVQYNQWRLPANTDNNHSIFVIVLPLIITGSQVYSKHRYRKGNNEVNLMWKCLSNFPWCGEDSPIPDHHRCWGPPPPPRLSGVSTWPAWRSPIQPR